MFCRRRPRDIRPARWAARVIRRGVESPFGERGLLGFVGLGHAHGSAHHFRPARKQSRAGRDELLSHDCSALLAGLALAGVAAARGNCDPAQETARGALDETAFVGQGGYAIQLDNDLFSGAHRDQDYSWGGGVTYASPNPGPVMKPLHATRRFLDRWLAPDESDQNSFVPQQQATQIGILAMTPSVAEVRRAAVLGSSVRESVVRDELRDPCARWR